MRKDGGVAVRCGAKATKSMSVGTPLQVARGRWMAVMVLNLSACDTSVHPNVEVAGFRFVLSSGSTRLAAPRLCAAFTARLWCFTAGSLVPIKPRRLIGPR
jgi:hypothetical protein